MYSNDRHELRKVYFESFHKQQNGLPLTPLEAQIVDILLLHPEYHDLLSSPEEATEDAFAEENPFLHLSLHLAIREQISTDRPAGIADIHRKLCLTLRDAHQAEHNMMECLGQVLWEAQQTKKMPDEATYIELLRKC